MATAEGCRRPGLVSDDLNTQLQPQANSFVCIFFFLSLLLALLLNKSVNKYELGRLLLKLCICAQPLPSTPPPTNNHPQPLTRPSVASHPLTFCSARNETLLSRVSLQLCVTAAALLDLPRTGVRVMQMCPGIPAHMTLCRRREKRHRHRR